MKTGDTPIWVADLYLEQAGKASLGLSDGTLEQLISSVDTVFHCAASTSLSMAGAEGQAVNRNGTRQVLEFALRAGGSQLRRIRFVHVSTAYVAGHLTGVVTPDVIPIAGFRNEYERSKAEAEWLVRKQVNALDVLIARPSIIIRDTRQGYLPWKSALPLVVRALLQQGVSGLPVGPDAALDLVPVDLVASSLIELSKTNMPSGSCFHIAAGPRNETRFAALLELLAVVCQKKGITGPGAVSTARRPRVSRLLKPYVPYLNGSAHFDIQATCSAIPEYADAVSPAGALNVCFSTIEAACIEYGDSLQDKPGAEGKVSGLICPGQPQLHRS